MSENEESVDKSVDSCEKIGEFLGALLMYSFVKMAEEFIDNMEEICLARDALSQEEKELAIRCIQVVFGSMNEGTLDLLFAHLAPYAKERVKVNVEKRERIMAILREKSSNEFPEFLDLGGSK